MLLVVSHGKIDVSALADTKMRMGAFCGAGRAPSMSFAGRFASASHASSPVRASRP